MPSALVGAVLTYGAVDGSRLQLTVSISEPATVALSWGDLERRAFVGAPHTFGDLPAPTSTLTYSLAFGTERRTFEVRPPRGTFDIAVYGDSRGGTGPHAALIEQIATWHPDVVIHTGDVIQWAGDTNGWARHLATTLPLTTSIPVVLALGNHELWEYWQAPRTGSATPLEEAMRQIPPPPDPIATEAGVFPSCFHVRVGSVLIVSMDSNQALGADTRPFAFLTEVLRRHADAETKLVTMHHGPRSSGHHGGHPDGEALLELGRAMGVDAFLAGHDHVYERLEDRGIAVIVTGGGGAPLYDRERVVRGSRAFTPAYNWVALEVGSEIDLTARTVEGVVLDRARLGLAEDRPRWVFPSVIGAAVLFFGAALRAIVRIVLGRAR
jgi:hypothetical protein